MECRNRICGSSILRVGVLLGRKINKEYVLFAFFIVTNELEKIYKSFIENNGKFKSSP